MVRPNRYALAVELEGGLDDNEVAMHWRCDNPLCVNTGDGDAFAAHVVLASAAENMADMGRKGRGGGRRLWFGADRAERARRSRAVREAVLRYGWDQHAIETSLYDGARGTLWWLAGDRLLMCRGGWLGHGGCSMMRVDRCTRVGAVSETLGVLMQRSEAEAALLGAVLEVMPISDLALDAAVAGIPVLDVPRTRGIDICFSDKADIL